MNEPGLLEFAKWLTEKYVGECVSQAVEDADPIEALQTQVENLELANVGLSKAYQKAVEEAETLKKGGWLKEYRDELKALQDQLTAAESDRDGLRAERDDWKRRFERLQTGESELMSKLASVEARCSRQAETIRDLHAREARTDSQAPSLRFDLNVLQGLLKSVAERLEKREQAIYHDIPSVANPTEAVEITTLRALARFMGEIYREIDQHLSES